MSMKHSYVSKEFPDDYVNPRGIPRVTFIDNIDEHIKTRGVTVDTMLRQMQESHSKYKLMEHKLQQNRSLLEGKIPEINKNIDIVSFLKKKLDDQKESFSTHYGLTDSVFAEAEVPPQKTLHLWLGANTMVEFTFDDALVMLNKNLEAAKVNLTHVLDDLAWLRDQQTILEVNTARVYNHDVVRRREEAAVAAKK